MNTYRATATYKDGQQINADLIEEDINRFAQCISKREIFWNKTLNDGFWTNLDDIRYINFRKINEKKDEPTPKRSKKAKRPVRAKAVGHTNSKAAPSDRDWETVI